MEGAFALCTTPDVFGREGGADRFCLRYLLVTTNLNRGSEWKASPVVITNLNRGSEWKASPRG